MLLTSVTLMVELVLVTFIHSALPWSTSSDAIFDDRRSVFVRQKM